MLSSVTAEKSRGLNSRFLYTDGAMVKLEVAIGDQLLDQTIEAITKAANSGKIGDGKIFVSPLEQVIRIRTGETGEAAI